MKTLKQLLRQPLKTFTGLVLMTLAAAIVCLCVGQALAAESTKKDLDERFSTVGIASLQEDLTGAEQIRVEEELLAWLEKMAQEHPDIVKGLAPNGLLSAYIPQLSPYNTNAQAHVANYAWDAALYPTGANIYAGTTHYDSAMLVITLEQISDPITPMDTYTLRELLPSGWINSGDDWMTFLLMDRMNAYRRGEDVQVYQQIFDMMMESTLTEGYTVELTGTVTQVVSLPEDMRDPVGSTARLTLTLPTLEEIEALGLVPGEQYIVYGVDYFDDYQFFVQYMKTARESEFKHISFMPFDPALVEEPTQQEKINYLKNRQIDAYMLYNFAPLEKWQYERFNSISMTLCAPSNLIPYVDVLNEAGEVVDRIPQTEVTYTDGSGQTHTIPMAEYNDRYAVPTIAGLKGSVEDFLASEAGVQWQEALEQAQVNNHAFSVIGVNDMHQLGAFALGKSQMGEGREFTAEEVETGAKVCIVHELVAQQSGLQIGDTVTLSFYSADPVQPYQSVSVQALILQKTCEATGKPYQSVSALEKGLLQPAAGQYLSTTPVLETGEYTIVGFWQGSAWPDADDNYYCFSANTVFVPYASVQSPMERKNSIPFVSVSLENGTISQFHELVKRAGYAGRFKYNDQGYSDIAVNFHNYESLGRQIMLVGIVIYAILLLLFLLLYPSSQGKTVWTMESMGCNYAQRFGHVLLSSMLILVAASALGALVGSALWEHLVAALQKTAESSIALQLEPGMLASVAAAQLLLSLLLSAFVAVLVALPRGIAKRR